MITLANRYRAPGFIRQNRPLTNDELARIVPSAFSSDKHDSRSDRYTYIPTINILDRLRDEGFEPFYARQSNTRDIDKRGAGQHSLIGTCKLNGVEPESYLRYVLDVIADWPINRVSELLPWRIALPTE